MPGIIPEPISGALVVRGLDNVCLSPGGVSNAYCPPPAFTSDCAISYLPNDCTARFTAAQVNAFQSEMLCLAVAMDPNGNWDCDALCNLGAAFSSYVSDVGNNTLWRRLQTHICGMTFLAPAVIKTNLPNASLIVCDGLGNLIRTEIPWPEETCCITEFTAQFDNNTAPNSLNFTITENSVDHLASVPVATAIACEILTVTGLVTDLWASNFINQGHQFLSQNIVTYTTPCNRSVIASQDSSVALPAAGGGSAVIGGTNVAVNANNSIGSGNGNTTAANNSLVSGSGNAIGAGANTVASGAGNLISGNAGQVAGTGNTVAGNNSEASGLNNTVNGNNNSATGTSNIVNGTGHDVSGSANNVSGTNSDVSGNENVVAGANQLVTGTSNNVNGTNNVVAGTLNNVSGPGVLSNLIVGSGHALLGSAADNTISGINHTIVASNVNSISGNSHDITDAGSSNMSGFNNTINIIRTSIVGGTALALVDVERSLITGNSHNVNNLRGSAISGTGHDVSNTINSVISGVNNDVTNISSTVISGADHNGDTISNTVISGLNNEATNTLNCAISGTNHDVTNISHTVISGTNNDVTDTLSSVVSGSNQVVSNNSHSMVYGFNNTITGGPTFPTTYSLLIGGHNNIISDLISTFVAGFRNTVNRVNLSGVFGRDHVLNNMESGLVTGQFLNLVGGASPAGVPNGSIVGGGGAGPVALSSNRRYQIDGNTGNARFSGAVTAGFVFPGFGEYFGNPDGLDRGVLVATDNGINVRAANPDDVVIGVTRRELAMSAGGLIDPENSPYMIDEWGDAIWEDYTFEPARHDFGRNHEDGTPSEVLQDGTPSEVLQPVTERRKVPNPNYDPKREFRTIGVEMIGRIMIGSDGRVSRGDYIRSGEGGIAVRSEQPTRIRAVAVNGLIVTAIIQ